MPKYVYEYWVVETGETHRMECEHPNLAVAIEKIERDTEMANKHKEEYRPFRILEVVKEWNKTTTT